MPTMISHAVVAFGAGALLPQHKSFRFWACAVLASVIPDFDVLAFKFGIPYAHPFGHRGYFHSLSFALIWGIFTVLVFFRPAQHPRRQRVFLALFFFALTACHDLLDAMTNGGLGIALLAPFSNERIFFPFAPIQVSPIGLRGFLSERGLQVLASEAIWVWVPTAVFVSLGIGLKVLLARRGRTVVSVGKPQ